MANKALLLILDGWGLRAEKDGNAVANARTPFLDSLFARYPHTRLVCHGRDVGLPVGIMGNSEVGHLNLGAGRIVYQDIVRIDKAIEDGDFYQNPVLLEAIEKASASRGGLHLAGLLSDGGVHSHITQLYALLKLAKANNVKNTFIHVILDGRDTAPDSGQHYVRALMDYIAELGHGEIATVCGRYYAMDRDKRWERNREAYRLWTEGVGTDAEDPLSAVLAAYGKGQTDEFVRPVRILREGRPFGTLKNGDAMVFFNFRADRARQISRALTDPDFAGFSRPVTPQLAAYVCLTTYDAAFPLSVAFPPQKLTGILGEHLSALGRAQLRIAETEKYAHVTYFFNGGIETPFPGEDRCLVPSPREVPTYDFKPEMSAPLVAGELCSRILAGHYEVIVCNFANMDMVGHTGVYDAALKAVETVDQCAAKVIGTAHSKGFSVFVCADHGNAETMWGPDGKPHTAHTLNPVPLILADDRYLGRTLRSGGRLGDVAPTILSVLGIEKPLEMTGVSLLEG
jgi:2,3-bisphosphoglycerate-independent phosphoglycerate mutase